LEHARRIGKTASIRQFERTRESRHFFAFIVRDRHVEIAIRTAALFRDAAALFCREINLSSFSVQNLKKSLSISHFKDKEKTLY
jgi:hypothetical protein